MSPNALGFNQIKNANIFIFYFHVYVNTYYKRWLKESI